MRMCVWSAIKSRIVTFNDQFRLFFLSFEKGGIFFYSFFICSISLCVSFSQLRTEYINFSWRCLEIVCSTADDDDAVQSFFFILSSLLFCVRSPYSHLFFVLSRLWNAFVWMRVCLHACMLSVRCVLYACWPCPRQIVQAAISNI